MTCQAPDIREFQGADAWTAASREVERGDARISLVGNATLNVAADHNLKGQAVKSKAGL